MVKFKNVKGLTDAEVKQSKAAHGTNELPSIEVESFFEKLKGNFEDPLIRILLVALGVTLGLAAVGYADWLEGIGIGIAVGLATFVSTYSEYSNEASFRKLQEDASRIKSNLFRNGALVSKDAIEIVVGDFVLLQAGDMIPADGRLFDGSNLGVNQATLTGERVSKTKSIPAPDYKAKHTDDSEALQDPNLIFRGSVVDEGEAVMIVDSIGTNTIFGKIYADLHDSEERDSPLKVKLTHLADQVSTFGYVGATFIAISFLFKQFVIDQGYSYDKITTYLSLANWQVALHDVVTSAILAIIVIVVAVPEGLPMMIAIVLSLNMRKLLDAQVHVRKLMGIETAGSLDTLFVDKTGTLTKGIFSPQGFVSGLGNFSSSMDGVPEDLRNLVGFCIRESTSAVVNKDGKAMGGNSSDRALLEFIPKKLLDTVYDVSTVEEVLFNSERKFSASQLKFGKNKPKFTQESGITIVKGAPDLLLPNCKDCWSEEGQQTKFTTEKVIEAINEISKKGVRVIAITTSDMALPKEGLPSSLTLVGVIGITDELRKESTPAIHLAKKAGIQVIMITGDRKETAVAVAQELGLLSEGRIVLTSSQLKELPDEQLKEYIPKIAVIARALPIDKSRLVKVCQSMNRVVGMTGDGVNDSSALKKSDVGFAMGSGSEVAKEASDIVILDDNFASITQAVLYGRTIFKSIRKFVVFQSTVNVASLFLVFMGPFLGFDFPLTLIQLLWVNLVMDTLAALAFGGEPALNRYMEEKPIPRHQAIINPQMWSAILVNGLFIASLCIGALIYPPVRELFVRDGKPNEEVFLTAFFAFFIFLTNFNAFNARTAKINIFDHILENRGFVQVVALIFAVQITFTYLGGSFLRTVGLTLSEWILIFSLSVLIIPFDMIRKLIMMKIVG